MFDSDVMLKVAVHAALSRLKPFLELRGARVAVIYLPAGDGGVKVGLDDFLAAGNGVDDLLAAAVPTLRPLPVGEASEQTDDGKAGSALQFLDPEAWPVRVVGFELLEALAATIARYVVLPAGAADLVALWVTHTYLMDAWEHTGYLAITGPAKRCGKTTLLRVVRDLVRRALGIDSVSPAALYRVIEEWSPTLMIDEVDRIHRDSDVWSVLNSGHTRGGAVLRCAGDESEPRAYRTWAPKVLAYIRTSRSTVPDTVEDRCIRVVLQRRAPGETRDRLRSRTLDAEAAPLRRRLVRWADDHREAIAFAAPSIPEELDDRAADSWEPLFAVADAAGGRWPETARRLAISYSGERAEEDAEAPGIAALADLGAAIREGRLVADEYGLAAEDMARVLRDLSDRPWRTWGRRGDGITTTALGRLLRPHGIRSELRGPETRRVRRYAVADMLSACERYVATRTPAQPATVTPATLSSTEAERLSGLESLSEEEILL